MNGVEDSELRQAPRPKKSLAQNFLVDETHRDRIIAAADLTPADTVLEIGPGRGVLTTRLAQQAGRVIAVELDDRLIEPLRQQFAGQPHVTIIHGDILELDPVRLIDDGQWTIDDSSPDDSKSNIQHPEPYKVVANLPYYITSAVLRHILEARVRPTLAVVMVQREVAERICAGPGEMSLLAVSVQFYAEPRIVDRVPAGAFRPQPKVDSAVLRLDVRPQPAVADVTPAAFFRVVRAGFSQKRKQLLNTLSAGLRLSKSVVREALIQADIDPTRRAETLSLTEWGALCRALTE
ncbi:MAG: ribosomal RNA small subunit methyltransferase A [Chloroflexi bacterium]|nr:MAG: ribosomal RNA small subunit methyltransferase A [Chloroflexota bacterium]